MLTTNLAILKENFFFNFIKLLPESAPDYHDSEHLRSQEGKDGVDLQLGNGYCEGADLFHSNVSLNPASIFSLLSFSLLPFNIA